MSKNLQGANAGALISSYVTDSKPQHPELLMCLPDTGAGSKDIRHRLTPGTSAYAPQCPWSEKLRWAQKALVLYGLLSH
ncbi:hypothetical protein TNCV_2196861 [Trichonephila clavipes]|nr:hypothetical protein TNCV_2196861 [Trichonephila clavipes]